MGVEVAGGWSWLVVKEQIVSFVCDTQIFNENGGHMPSITSIYTNNTAYAEWVLHYYGSSIFIIPHSFTLDMDTKTWVGPSYAKVSS